MAAVGLFLGSGLVIEFLNDEAKALLGDMEYEGVPLVEAVPGAHYRDAITMMSRVYQTRRPECMPWFSGVLWVVPVSGGVATHFQAAPQPRPHTPSREAYQLAPAR